MNIENLHYINLMFGSGVILLQVFTVLAIFFLLFGSAESKYLSFIKKHFIEIGFLISLSALLVSLFYSEVVGFLPCKHCWIQRVFIFPQVFLFAAGWVRKDRNVIWYSVPLLVIGLIDSLYLVFLYYFRPFSGPCDASGVSCVQQLVSEFGGYITIPTLSLSGFLALLTLLAVAHFYKKEV